jgi:hypothetical protein
MGKKCGAAGIEHGAYQPQRQDQPIVHAETSAPASPASLDSVAPIKQECPKQTLIDMPKWQHHGDEMPNKEAAMGLESFGSEALSDAGQRRL